MKSYYLWIIALCLPALFFVPTNHSVKELGKLEYNVIPQIVRSPDNPERERRDAQVKPFLMVAIGTEGSMSCSGTICYYNSKTGAAYVIGCAHCYKPDEKCKVRTYFHNGEREVKEFNGKLLAYDPTNDLSLITFKPDFIPDWVPIGTKDSPFYYPTRATAGVRVIVTGRDAGLEDVDRRPAAYEAFIRPTTNNWYLHSNQSLSRGGRSGGGVMTTNRQWLIGVNHGRGETVDGIGHGMWIPLWRIHRFLKQNRLYWLTTVGRVPEMIPIKGPRLFPQGYVPRVQLKEVYIPNE